MYIQLHYFMVLFTEDNLKMYIFHWISLLVDIQDYHIYVLQIGNARSLHSCYLIIPLLQLFQLLSSPDSLASLKPCNRKSQKGDLNNSSSSSVVSRQRFSYWRFMFLLFFRLSGISPFRLLFCRNLLKQNISSDRQIDMYSKHDLHRTLIFLISETHTSVSFGSWPRDSGIAPSNWLFSKCLFFFCRWYKV